MVGYNGLPIPTAHFPRPAHSLLPLPSLRHNRTQIRLDRGQIVRENTDSPGLKWPCAPVQRRRASEAQEVEPQKAREQPFRRFQSLRPTRGNTHRRQQRQSVRGFQKMSDHAVHLLVGQQRQLEGKGARRSRERLAAECAPCSPADTVDIGRRDAEQCLVRRQRVISRGRRHRHKKRVEQRYASAVIRIRSTVIPSRDREEHALGVDQPARDDSRGAVRSRGISRCPCAVQRDRFA